MVGVNHSDKHSSLKNRNLPYLFQMLYSCREVKANGPVFNATKLLVHLEFLNQWTHITCSKTCTIFFFHCYHSQATVFHGNCTSEVISLHLCCTKETHPVYHCFYLSLILASLILGIKYFKEYLKEKQRRIGRIVLKIHFSILTVGAVRC